MDMGDAPVRTDKGLQIKVLGAIGILITLMVAVVQLFLETSTISLATIILLLGMLFSIAYLAIDL